MDTDNNWEDHVTPEMLRYVKSVEKDFETKGESNVSSLELKLVKSVKMSALHSPTNCHIEATPLLEVSSVTIRLDDWREDFKLYGYLRLISDKDDEFPVFNRVITEPVTGSKLDGVSAILHKCHFDRPYWLPNYFRLKLFLKDKIRGAKLVNEDLLLDFCGNDVIYDEEQVLNVKQCVTVHYTIFQCAILAFVKLTILRNDDEKRGDVVVRGTISASSKVTSGKRISRMLFAKEFEYVHLVPDFPTELSAVAVPVYSSLEIEANLEVDGEEIEGVLEFVPNGNGSRGVSYKKEIDVGQPWRIRVSVVWVHAFDLLDNDEFYELVTKPESKTIGEEYPDCEPPYSFQRKFIKEGEYSSEDQLLCSDQKSTQRVQRSILGFGRILVEVFSITIHSFGHDDGALYGTITSYDSLGTYKIFERDEKAPVIVYPSKILSLSDYHPYTAEGAYFGMDLDLKDAEGREISKGYVGWNRFSPTKWRNRRICSVVSGKEGFATVHYTIFDNAVLAQLRVRFVPHFESLPSGESDQYEVYGRIYARYNNYMYSNHYEKTYYSRILFNKVDEPEILKKLDDYDDDMVEVPLSKHVMAVPLGASLIMVVDLQVRASHGQMLERIKGEEILKPGIWTVNGTLPGSYITLSLELQCS